MLCFLGGQSSSFHDPHSHVDRFARGKLHASGRSHVGLALLHQTEPSLPVLQRDCLDTAEEGKKYRYYNYNVIYMKLCFNLIFLFCLSSHQAFVFFSDWTACCKFAQDHITNPVSVKGCMLSVHFVLQPMNPETSEVRILGKDIKWLSELQRDQDGIEKHSLEVVTETNVSAQ